jgi:hypothetical protein
MRADVPLRPDSAAAREAAALSDHIILDLQDARAENVLLARRVHELEAENAALRSAAANVDWSGE